jgi:hypothetical protein
MSAEVFYPQHFKVTRPYVKAFAADIAEQAAKGSLSPKTSHTLSSRRILEAYEAIGARPGTPAFDMRGFAVENQAALMYAEWVERGAVLYDFKAPLADALSATSVDQISISDLQFPFDCAYFSFGPRKDLVLQSGAEVTGAFVLWSPGQALRLTLTAPLPAETPLTSRFEEVYDLRILAKHFHVNLETAIEEALRDDEEDLHQAAQTLKGQPAARQLDGVRTIERALATNAANARTFARCARLVASALCYVTAFPSDSFVDWQDGTPEKLRTKASGVPSKEAARATSKLNALGYRRIHHVGREFWEAAEKSGESQVGPHIRRGHWRSQAHGPEMSLRKIIWIRQTRVLGGPISSDEPRVYSTERPGTSTKPS